MEKGWRTEGGWSAGGRIEGWGRLFWTPREGVGQNKQDFGARVGPRCPLFRRFLLFSCTGVAQNSAPPSPPKNQPKKRAIFLDRCCPKIGQKRDQNRPQKHVTASRFFGGGGGAKNGKSFWATPVKSRYVLRVKRGPGCDLASPGHVGYSDFAGGCAWPFRGLFRLWRGFCCFWSVFVFVSRWLSFSWFLVVSGALALSLAEIIICEVILCVIIICEIIICEIIICPGHHL